MSVLTLIRKFPLSASPARLCLEAAFVMLLVSTGLYFVSPVDMATGTLQLDALAAGLLGAAWAAFRLRLPKGSWQTHLLYEIGSAAALSATLILCYYLLAFVRDGAASRTIFPGLFSNVDQVLLAIIPPLFYAAAYLLSRGCVRIWLVWLKLRRASFMWSLTHAILVTALLVASPLLLLVVSRSLQSNASDNQSLFSVLLRTLPIFVFVVASAAVGLFLLLPVAAAFSLVVARRLTRRLNALTTAAGRLRAGDYSARALVQGEDEVAQLQRDFNAMADSLENSIETVAAERDAVSTVLDSRRQLVANVSHELRTPVATLRGYLDSALLNWKGEPPPSLHRDLETMQHEIMRLQTLIDDLFTLARAEVSKLELRMEPTEINDMAQRCVEAVAPLAWRSSRVDVTADLAPSLAYAYADPDRVQQIIYNLLHNAVRHTGPGGIVVVSVSVGSNSPNSPNSPNSVTLLVRDTGEGIAPDQLEHIWERFYQADNASTSNRAGAGLGLSLVKELAESMGGTVWVESTVGEGSGFGVTFPGVVQPGVIPPMVSG